MKKLFNALLCLLLAGLYACGSTTPEDETTTQPTNTEITVAGTTKVFEPTFTIKTSPDDPNSYVIEEYLDIYNEVLNDDNRSMPDYYFFLYDLDGDGTKELLLGQKNWDGKIHLDSVHVIQNGVAVDQVALTPWMEQFATERCLLKNGTIKIGNSYCSYSRLEDGELKRQVGLSCVDNEYTRREYDNSQTPAGFTDTPITKEEYDRVKREMEGDGQLVELDWKPLAEYGR